MSKPKKLNFSPEFRLETSQLVVDNGYTHESAAKAVPMTPEKIKIRELKKRIQRIELERDILRKAIALLMSDSLNNSY
jgi:transposase